MVAHAVSPAFPDLRLIKPGFELSAMLYHKLFGVIPDFSGLSLPELPDDRGGFIHIVMHEDLRYLTRGRLYGGIIEAERQHFRCNVPENLDETLTVNARHPFSGSYVVSLLEQAVPEGERELEGYSVADINEYAQPCTLAEYLLASFAYFLKHDGHMDKAHWTAAAGSRFGYDKEYPLVGWAVMMLDLRIAPTHCPFVPPTVGSLPCGIRRVWVSK